MKFTKEELQAALDATYNYDMSKIRSLWVDEDNNP